MNAEDIAFEVERIEIDVGETATLTFNNSDADIPHNFRVRAGAVDAKTEIRPGPDTQTWSSRSTRRGATPSSATCTQR